MGNGIAVAHETAAPDTPHDIEPPELDRFVGESECARLTSLGRITRWRLERAGQFPRRRQLSPNRVGWSLSEVLAWQQGRAAA